MSDSARVVAAGHLCVDLIPEIREVPTPSPGALIDVGALTMRVGGCVGNTSVALARLGVGVEVQAVVGDDPLGGIIRDDLRRAGVGVDRIVTTRAATSYSIVVEPRGADRIFWHYTGANDVFDGRDVVLDGADLLHVGYPSLLPALVADEGAPLARLFRRARTAGIVTSADLAVVDPVGPAGSVDWDAVLAGAGGDLDVLTPSYDDLASMWRDDPTWSLEGERAYAKRLLGYGIAVVAISSGARGLAVYTAGVDRLRTAGRALASAADRWSSQTFRHHVEAIERPVSTNGAGDASTAGFLAAIVNGRGPDAAAEFAALSSRAVLRGETASFSASSSRVVRSTRSADEPLPGDVWPSSQMVSRESS